MAADKPPIRGLALFHQDGIRVTLRPKGKRTSRHGEAWLDSQTTDQPAHDYDGRYVTCSLTTRTSHSTSEVMFRRFNMYNANAINIGVGKGFCSKNDRVMRDADYTWNSAVAWNPLSKRFYAGANLIERSWKMRLAMDALPHAGPGETMTRIR